MRPAPLRVRLTLAFAVGMAVVFVALGVVLHARFAADLTRSIDLDLRSRGQVIVAAIGRQDLSVVKAGGNLIDPDEAFAQVLDRSDRIVDTSAGVSAAPLLTPATVAQVHGLSFSTARVQGVDDPVRLLAVPIERDSERLVVVVGATLGDRNEALGRLTLLLAVVGPIALAVVCAGGWLLAGAALRPVERMRREAAAISVSDFERRLPVSPAGDELSRLGVTLNSMLDRLEESFRSQGRFVDQASHELRTPLGVLKAELDLALARSRTPQELEAALRNASGETDRLVRLAEDLLVLARASDGRLPVRRIPVSVATLLERVRTAYEARATAAGVAITVTAPPDLTIAVDPSRIRQAVESLLDNALRHAPGGRGIEVDARQQGVGGDDGSVTIMVRDHGPGFPAAVLGRPPEPFLRPDGDVTPGGGAGLGLAIVRAIAEAHGGAVSLENEPAGGARVTMVLRGRTTVTPDPDAPSPGRLDSLGAMG